MSANSARHPGLAILILAAWSGLLSADGTVRTDAFGDPLPSNALARMGTIRFRPNRTYTCLDLAPNGLTFSASVRSEEGEDSVCICSIKTSEILQRWPGGVGLYYSPDGRHLVKTRMGEIEFWEVSHDKAITR